MRNIAEEIAYWYLRLNNFFLIENFVVHQGRRGTDQDFLALRPLGAEEWVGGRKLQSDSVFDECSKSEAGETSVTGALGLIVQVKGGTSSQVDVGNVFSEENLQYALHRFGIHEKDAVTALQQGEPYTKLFGLTVCTMLFKRRGVNSEHEVGVTVDLEDALEFLRRRAAEEAEERRKSKTDWHLFPTGVFQYFLVEQQIHHESAGE